MADGVSTTGLSLNYGVYDKYSGKYINSADEKSSTLGQNDFMKLIIAQLQNQDFNNSTDTSEFINQMAQMATIESMNTMTANAKVTYAASFTGKYVTCTTGDGGYVTGLVDCVAINGDKCTLVIGGKEYDAANVCEIITKETYDKLVAADKNKNNTDETGETTDETTTDEAADAAENTDSTTETQSLSYTEVSVQSKIDKLIEEYEKTTAELYNELQKSIEEIRAEADIDDGTVMTVEKLNYGGRSDFDVEMKNVKAGTSESMSVNVSSAAASKDTPLISGSSSSVKNTKDTPITSSGANLYGNAVNTSGSTKDLELCAAKAAETGTRMKDLQYIFNTSIENKIDTSKVLGVTKSGKAFTDIGYSGRGRLGEVVTWADGTQRVEVISPYGYSTYFTTSGNYTLDTICDFDCAPGEYAGKFNGNELSIRYFAREYTDAEKSAMNSFMSFLRGQGIVD